MTDIKQLLINMINNSFETGNLTELPTQSLLSLLLQNVKHIYDIKNWRTVSLLDVLL